MTRTRLALRLLIFAATVSLGISTRALSWPPGPAAGLTVAFAGLVLVTSSLLAIRILVIAGDAGTLSLDQSHGRSTAQEDTGSSIHKHVSR